MAASCPFRVDGLLSTNSKFLSTRWPIEIVTNVSDHGCNGPEKTGNPGRVRNGCSCRRNVAHSTFDTRNLCDALVGDSSVLYIAETRLSYLCDVYVPASSGLFGFVRLEQPVFWTFVAFNQNWLLRPPGNRDIGKCSLTLVHVILIWTWTKFGWTKIGQNLGGQKSDKIWIRGRKKLDSRVGQI